MTPPADRAWTYVAGTGHRDLKSGDPAWVAEQLPQAAVWLRDQAGTTVGISGLALGFDMDWAEAVLDARMALWVAIPFLEQPARWPAAQRARWTKLRAAAARERIVGALSDNPKTRSAEANRLLHKRNTVMLDAARAVITDWEPGRVDGGTAGALLTAGKRAMPGIHLDPVERRVHFQLPTTDRLERYALQNTRCGHIAYVGPRSEARLKLAALTASGCPSWRIRAAHTRETWDDGCADCLVDLAASATTKVPARLVSARV